MQQSKGHELAHLHPTLDSYISKFNSNGVHINKAPEISKRETLYILILYEKSGIFSTG